MTAPAVSTLPARGVPMSEGLLAATLAPYSAKGCRYLREAEYLPADAGSPGLPAAQGLFGIPESSYIQDTGHFNAAEFVVAYNQLFYCLLAEAVDRGHVPGLEAWTLADLHARQLPDVLIQQCTSQFHAPIDARSFTGSITVDSMRLVQRRRRYVQLETSAMFRDLPGREQRGGAAGDGGPQRVGRATGRVVIAVLVDAA